MKTAATLAAVAIGLTATVLATQHPIVVTSDRTLEVDAGPFTASAYCGNGQTALSGGYQLNGRRITVTATQPATTDTNDGGWTVTGTAGRGGGRVTVWVKCAQWPTGDPS